MNLLMSSRDEVGKGFVNFNLYLNDGWYSPTKIDHNEVGYCLDIMIPKSVDVDAQYLASNIEEILNLCFISPGKYKKALYISSEYEINEYGEGFIDLFYDKKYKHPILDKGYETDDEEIGKNLLSVHLEEEADGYNVIRLEFKSLFLVDELYNMQTLWEINNGQVYKFLIEELEGIISEF